MQTDHFFRLTIKHVKDTVKALKPVSQNIIEISKTTREKGVNKAETLLNYDIPTKKYILTHNGKTVRLGNAEDAAFIFNWYSGTFDELNIKEVNVAMSNPIKTY